MSDKFLRLPLVASVLLLLAVALGSCDLMRPTSTGEANDLTRASTLDAENQREELAIDLHVPSLVCKDAEADTLKPVLFDPEVGDPGPFYAIERGINSGIEVRDRASYANGDGPVWSPVDGTGTVPEGHTKIAKIPFRLAVSITGFENQQRAFEKYESDLPTEITVRFKPAQDLDAGTQLYSSSGDRGFEKTWSREGIQNFMEDNEDLPMQLIASWGGGLNALKQGIALGTPVIEIKMPEESRFLQSLKVGARGDLISGEERVSGEELVFRISQDHGYALNDSPIDNAGDRFSEFADKISDDLLLVSLVGAAGGLAAGVATTVAALGFGGAAAGFVVAFAAVELAGPVCDLLSRGEGTVCNIPDGPGALAKATLKSATSFFAPPPKEGVGSCDFDGEQLEIDSRGNNIQNAGPALSGPLVVAAAEQRRTLEEVQASETSSLSGFTRSDATWVDLNQDQNDELVVSGNTAPGSDFIPRTTVYRREGLLEISTVEASLPDVGFSTLESVETSDGTVLLAVSGFEAGGLNPVTKAYRLTGGGFEEVGGGSLVDVGQGDLAWTDYNQDGKPDLLVSGYRERSIDPTAPVTKLYRNTGDGFEEVEGASESLVDVGQSGVAWTSSQTNSSNPRSDLVVTGLNENGEATSRLYEIVYNGSSADVNQIDSTIPALSDGSLAWSDFTGNGQPDLALSGFVRSGGAGALSRVYRRNEDGTFEIVLRNPAGFQAGDVNWIDYTGDGDVDLVLSGEVEGAEFPQLVLLRNLESGTFAEPVFFEGARFGGVASGDFDGDQNPDVAVTGEALGEPRLQIYRNSEPED